MTNFSSLLFLAIAALLVVSTSTEAIPVKASTAKSPVFSVYQKSNFKGQTKKITGYSKCVNHGLKTIGSVHYGSGPKANLKFYKGKNCSGPVTHHMSSETWGQMGGPYPSQSVSVSK
ncbi:hypothetical protein EMPS_09599 [Entomortierella parvispora]|uniref:Uncharacterized protein n=1 Tax=Entomortierella parvispora TaxID=205924 RepID=A0A9P3HIK5_9FUNG|nr:hypothetical protein EMPS_09599 [Entomortierella parvispora]